MLAMNAMANILPINKLTTGAVSALYNNYFVPAGFTFSIWGVIYFFLACFTVYSSFLIVSYNDKPWHLAVTKLFIITNSLNALWIYNWHYLQIGLTVLIMLLLLLSLIRIYVVASINKSTLSTTEKWFIYAPIVLYIAWICVATIANIAAYLTHLQWNAFGIAPVFWSCALIFVAACVAMFFVLVKKEPLFGLVITWALIGITVKQQATNSIFIMGIVAASIVILACILMFIKIMGKQQPIKKPLHQRAKGF
jgi:translocator protein